MRQAEVKRGRHQSRRTCASPATTARPIAKCVSHDVRAYAMANQDCAACVGCGMCAHVCPRGVLKLEVKADRFKGGTPIRVYTVDL